MPNTDGQAHRSQLQRIAHRVMLERGLTPDFTAAALAELEAIHGPAVANSAPVRDLRNLQWLSLIHI